MINFFAWISLLPQTRSSSVLVPKSLTALLVGIIVLLLRDYGEVVIEAEYLY
jgi:hypothetical protein